MRGESPEAFIERMQAKAERARYFIGLEAAAAESQRTARGATKLVPKPKKEPAAKKPRPTAPKPARVRTGVRVCTGVCGRMIRPPKTKIADYPGTVRYEADGKCWSCTHAPQGTRHLATPPTCVACDFPLRRSREPFREGTRRHMGKGMCTTCYKRAKKPVAV